MFFTYKKAILIELEYLPKITSDDFRYKDLNRKKEFFFSKCENCPELYLPKSKLIMNENKLSLLVEVDSGFHTKSSKNNEVSWTTGQARDSLMVTFKLLALVTPQ